MIASLHDDDSHASTLPRILFAPVPDPQPPTAASDGSGGIPLPEWWMAWSTIRPESLWFGKSVAEAVGLALLGSEEEIGLPIEMGEAARE